MKNIAILTDLFRMALAGQINRAEFQDRWKSLDEDNEFYRTLEADLDDAITHTPYHLFKKQIDHSVWQGMREYRVMLCDYLLLSYYKGDSRDWLEKRNKIIEAIGKLKEVNEKTIEAEIRRIGLAN